MREISAEAYGEMKVDANCPVEKMNLKECRSELIVKVHGE